MHYWLRINLINISMNKIDMKNSDKTYKNCVQKNDIQIC